MTLASHVGGLIELNSVDLHDHTITIHSASGNSEKINLSFVGLKEMTEKLVSHVKEWEIREADQNISDVRSSLALCRADMSDLQMVELSLINKLAALEKNR